MTVILHNYFRSSASQRVRIALNLKGIAYEYRSVHLVNGGGEQFSAEYRALNPMREVPSLEIDGHVLAQSLPIIEYLEQTRPTPPLLPDAPHLRARARQIAEIVNSGIQPLQNLRVLAKIEGMLPPGQFVREEWCRHWISNGFEALEALVAQTAGRYAIGDSVSLADIFIAPQMGAARRFKVDLAPFPLLVRIDAALSELPAFADAAPERQPDAA
jgi:maleylpyruvate isomerase